MDTGRLVVVMANLSLVRHRDEDIVIARFEDLGLSAWGHSESQAVVFLKRLFHKFVHVTRRDGRLEERLNSLGVQWYWADQYPADLPRFEDTNALFGSGSEERDAWVDVTPRPSSEAYRMAA